MPSTSTATIVTLAKKLFEFKKRALVHFAVDPDDVWMTTQLAGTKTFFLPFNKGNGTGAGNPENPNGYKSSYLWEEIWQRDSMLDILGRFIHLQTDERTIRGKKIRKESMVFPRYHQLVAVRSLAPALALIVSAASDKHNNDFIRVGPW